ncbi:MAG: helix-turn-helix domain-containing protein, partial [Clostridia bacterium]|nr:helix-turn-helix domain-containing protein [Clostridia bacterium]
ALRLERAAALLENSGTSISKIAELCGFGSIHHFSNAYKQHFGISPASHREKHTKK